MISIHKRKGYNKIKRVIPVVFFNEDCHAVVTGTPDKKKGANYFFFIINSIITASNRERTMPVIR